MKKNLPTIDQLLEKPQVAYERFHQQTKLRKYQKQQPVAVYPKIWKTVFHKTYPRLPQIMLPKAQKVSMPIHTVLEKRLSKRVFSKKPLSLETLSSFLYFSAGQNPAGGAKRRFYPSAGGRFPLEVYILIQNSEIAKGLYHYNVKVHGLEQLDSRYRLPKGCFVDTPWAKNASALVFITAVFLRNTIKYGNRGYRMLLQESGCLMQNMYLLGIGLHCNVCAIGGFKEDMVDNLLDINSHQESVVGVIALGNSI